MRGETKRGSPVVAFVECTAFQAGDHAGEVEQRLRMPCATLVLAKNADPVTYDIRASAWSAIADALGLPLGRG